MSERLALSRRRAIAGLAAGGALAALPGCVTTNAATGRTSFTGTYDVDDDIRIGRAEHPKLLEAFGGAYDDARLSGYVDNVGRRLAAYTEYQQFPYQFTVLNTPIVNAFALPGGFVYVSRGLIALASNEAELAGVVGHELGHVNARHTAERLSAAQLAQAGVIAGAIGASLLGLPADLARMGETVAVLAIQSYSRSQEFEADMLGVRYMARAGYEPDAMVSFLGTLREQSIVEAKGLGLPAGRVDEFNMMSTHPRTIDRVKEATVAAEVERPASPRVGRQEYLARINGMLFGDDPSQGIVVGQRFVHPGLRFEFTAPNGFRLHNEPNQVVAQDPRGAAMVFDLSGPRRSGSLTSYLSNEWAEGASLSDLEPLEINGLAAATARTRVRTDRGSASARLVAIDGGDNRTYRFLFVAPDGTGSRFDDAFKRTTYSFRRLGSDEAASIRPLRLAIVDAGPDDRVSSLATKLPFGAQNEAWFRVLNDLEQNAEPTPGQPIKVFVT